MYLLVYNNGIYSAYSRLQFCIVFYLEHTLSKITIDGKFTIDGNYYGIFHE